MKELTRSKKNIFVIIFCASCSICASQPSFAERFSHEELTLLINALEAAQQRSNEVHCYFEALESLHEATSKVAAVSLQQIRNPSYALTKICDFNCYSQQIQHALQVINSMQSLNKNYQEALANLYDNPEMSDAIKAYFDAIKQKIRLACLQSMIDLKKLCRIIKQFDLENTPKRTVSISLDAFKEMAAHKLYSIYSDSLLKIERIHEHYCIAGATFYSLLKQFWINVEDIRVEIYTNALRELQQSAAKCARES